MEDVQFQPPEPAEPAEPVDPGYMLAYRERDIFDEDGSQLYSVSQLVRGLGTSIQEDPRVPAHSLEVEEALKPEGFCWVSKMDAYTKGQDGEQEDLCLSS